MNTSVKHSNGIVCIRERKQRLEVLMVCKRYTYAFGDFVQGKYPQGDFRKNTYVRDELIKMFNNMTVDEKMDILSLDFDRIWYRVWLKDYKMSHYIRAKSRFEMYFLLDNGDKLRKIISKSTHAEKLWEIPKGRKKYRGETDIGCAVREFAEETNISKKHYRFIPCAPRKLCWTDYNITYINTYFIAVMTSNVNIMVNFNTQDQIDEISDIRWMDIDTIKCFDSHGHMLPFVEPILKMVRKRL